MRAYSARVLLVVVSGLMWGALAAGQDLTWVGRLAAEGDPAYQRLAQRTPTPWLDARESNGIAYFAYSQNPRIERYDLDGRAWLASIPLAEAPTAFFVDSSGLYVSFGRRTSRLLLDGTGEVHLHNTNVDATALFTVNDYLYIYAPPALLSVNRWSGALLDSEAYFYTLQGFSVAPGLWKAFARSQGISPSDIFQVVLNPDGSLGPVTDSPYHGAYPSAVRTFVFPGGARVADDSGIVYNTANLTYANSLAGSFDDVGYYNGLPIVLRNGILYAYSAAFLRTGFYAPPQRPLGIFVRGASIFSFFQGASSLGVAEIPVSLLTPAPPGTPLDPTGLPYGPDAVEVGGDGIVYLLSRANLSIFRWSLADNRYLSTIPLSSAPSFMAHSATNQALYLAYPLGEITVIHLNTGSLLSEEPFVNSPQGPLGLSTASEFVFVCDPTGAWASHFTYSPTGQLLSQKDWNYFSQEYVWSPANRKMYHFRDDTIPNDILWEDISVQGVLGAQLDSPYHSSDGIVHPIRVAPDGSLVLLGSGRLYDGLSLDQLDTLSNNIGDAVWAGGDLFTLRSLGAGSQIQKWDQPNWGVGATRSLDGTLIRMFQVQDRLLVITLRAGKPWFSMWDLALNGEGVSILKDDGLEVVPAGSPITYAITLKNLSPNRYDNALVADTLPPELLEVEWTCAASTGSSCATGVHTGDLFDVVSILGGGSLVYTVRGTVVSSATGLVVNTATVGGAGPMSADTDLTQLGPAPDRIFGDGFEGGP